MKNNRNKMWVGVAIILVGVVSLAVWGVNRVNTKKTICVSNETITKPESTIQSANTKEAAKPKETEKPNATSEMTDGYSLVWEDQFDGDKLNPKDWSCELHEPGWINNELQEYTDSKENIYVKDGNLVIKAIKKQDKNGTTYTSGKVNTQGKHDYKYGRFEIRAKSTVGKGFLPAIWMMPTSDDVYGKWPLGGEIDIMEVLGNQPNTVYGTLHFGMPHSQRQGSYTLPESDFASDYHVYTCDWEPNEFRFYVDGILYSTVHDWFTKQEGQEKVAYPAPFDQKFYLTMNVAVGGTWPGDPNETTQFGEESEFKIDYVKVYQKDN